MKLEFESKEKMVEWIDVILNNYKEDETKKIAKSDDSNSLNEKYPISIDAQIEDVKNRVIHYVKVMEQSLK